MTAAPILVDDDPKIVTLVRTYLEREDFSVVTAAHGRAALVAGYAAPPEPQPRLPPTPLHLEAEHPGDLVQLDCFHVGRVTGTKGRVWHTRRSTSPAPSSGS